MDLESVKLFVENNIAQCGMRIVIILVVTAIADMLVKLLLKKLHKSKRNVDEEQERQVNTVFSVFYSIIKSVLYLIATLMILEQLHVDIKPILTAAGVLGVAVGFGSQRLVEDIIGGLTIILNSQIRVGDMVKIGDKTGIVEKFTLNMVVLRDGDGSVHFIRNGKIDIVSNMTQNFSYYVADISVAYKEDIEKIIEVIKSVGDVQRQTGQFKDDILAPIEVLGLDKFDESAIVVKARIKTKPIKQWAVGREFNLLLKKEFDRQGIEIPFSQIDVHVIQ